jgi:hypothetical protein
MRYLHYDVFTDTQFEGNQLAVFHDARGLSTAQMQTITKEMNFSEMHVHPAGRSAGTDVRMRIFTPGTELPMAGHPTIGSTFALAELGVIEAGRASFVFGLGVGPTKVELTWEGRSPVVRVDGSAAARVSPAGLAAPDIIRSVGLDPSAVDAPACRSRRSRAATRSCRPGTHACARRCRRSRSRGDAADEERVSERSRRRVVLQHRTGRSASRVATAGCLRRGRRRRGPGDRQRAGPLGSLSRASTASCIATRCTTWSVCRAWRWGVPSRMHMRIAEQNGANHARAGWREVVRVGEGRSTDLTADSCLRFKPRARP